MRTLAILVMGAVGAALAPPVAADSNLLHVGIHHSDPHDDPHRQDLDGAHVIIDIEEGFGYHLTYERRTGWITGLQLGVAQDAYDLDSGTRRRLVKLRARPYTANLLFHPIPAGPVDLYFGGGPAYVAFRGIDPGHGDLDSDLGWNVMVGLDIKFGKSPLGLNLYAQSMHAKVTPGRDLDLSSDLDVNPVNLGAGLAVRW